MIVLICWGCNRYWLGFGCRFFWCSVWCYLCCWVFCCGLNVCVGSLVMKIGVFGCNVWFSSWSVGMVDELLLLCVGELLVLFGVCVLYWFVWQVLLFVDLYLGKVDVFCCVGIVLFSGGIGKDL